MTVCYKTLKTTIQTVKIEAFPLILSHLFHDLQLDKSKHFATFLFPGNS